MDTTWIDVASDAVKIGLGALIGASSTIITAYLSHVHNRKHDYSTRRRTRLEEIMPEFDALSLEALRLACKFLVAVKDPNDAVVKVDPQVFDLTSEASNVNNINSRLNSVEANIALLDYPELAAKVEDFRDGFRSLVELGSASYSFAEGRVNNLGDTRHRIIEVFAEAYRYA